MEDHDVEGQQPSLSSHYHSAAIPTRCTYVIANIVNTCLWVGSEGGHLGRIESHLDGEAGDETTRWFEGRVVADVARHSDSHYLLAAPSPRAHRPRERRREPQMVAVPRREPRGKRASLEKHPFKDARARSRRGSRVLRGAWECCLAIDYPEERSGNSS